MDRSLLITLIVMIALTVVGAVFSKLGESGMRWIPLAIMAVASTKFILVAFRFMELNKAHVFWRISTVFICVLLAVLVGTLAK